MPVHANSSEPACTRTLLQQKNCLPPNMLATLLRLLFLAPGFTLFSASKSALFCRTKATAQSLERGSLRVDDLRKVREGKFLPELCVKKNWSDSRKHHPGIIIIKIIILWGSHGFSALICQEKLFSALIRELRRSSPFCGDPARSLMQCWSRSSDSTDPSDLPFWEVPEFRP